MSIETWETIRRGRVTEFLGTMAVRIEKRWYGSDITLIGPYGMGIDTASEPAWWAILVGSEDMRKSGRLAVSDLPGERILITLDPGSFIDRASLQPFWDWLSQAMDRYGFVESETKPAEKGVGNKPWERIPNVGYDREMVRLWHYGYQAPEIGRQLGKAGKTITNRLCELRRIHGTEIIPYRKSVRKLG